jgi:hypothetical protein
MHSEEVSSEGSLAESLSCAKECGRRPQAILVAEPLKVIKPLQHPGRSGVFLSVPLPNHQSPAVLLTEPKHLHRLSFGCLLVRRVNRSEMVDAAAQDCDAPASELGFVLGRREAGTQSVVRRLEFFRPLHRPETCLAALVGIFASPTRTT